MKGDREILYKFCTKSVLYIECLKKVNSALKTVNQENQNTINFRYRQVTCNCYSLTELKC